MVCRLRMGDNCKKDGRPCIFSEKCFEPKPTTNADRIRSMSDEELCEMLTMGTGGFDCGTCRDSNACDRECELHCAVWLKQPAKGR